MPITITTWNIQNFTRSDTVYSDKLALLTSTLRSLGADVVALQEVLNPDALGDLADGLGFQSVAAEPDGRGIRVAFLCRKAPVQTPRQIDQWRLPPDTPVRRLDSEGRVTVDARFPRPALQITVDHNGAEIDIITAHLKSKLLTFGGNFSTSDEQLRAHTAYFSLERRAAEATTLREHVSDLLATGRQVIVLGDMNDGPEAATTQILYGPPGSQPRGPDDAQRAAGAFQRADANDPRRLFNVTKLVPEAQRWSRRHNGQNELLDHILASQGLMPRVAALRQVPEVQILNADTPNLIEEHPTQGGVFPDHAPVTATFTH
jgi:endonuclease/exonuclease/phosphatase family metal-dependent hydrolase